MNEMLIYLINFCHKKLFNSINQSKINIKSIKCFSSSNTEYSFFWTTMECITKRVYSYSIYDKLFCCHSICIHIINFSKFFWPIFFSSYHYIILTADLLKNDNFFHGEYKICDRNEKETTRN